MSERIILSESDKISPAWGKVSKYLEQRLALLRAENDIDADERTTAKRRGAIAEIKHLQALGKEKPIL